MRPNDQDFFLIALWGVALFCHQCDRSSSCWAARSTISLNWTTEPSVILISLQISLICHPYTVIQIANITCHLCIFNSCAARVANLRSARNTTLGGLLKSTSFSFVIHCKKQNYGNFEENKKYKFPNVKVFLKIQVLFSRDDSIWVWFLKMYALS